MTKFEKNAFLFAFVMWILSIIVLVFQDFSRDSIGFYGMWIGIVLQWIIIISSWIRRSIETHE